MSNLKFGALLLTGLASLGMNGVVIYLFVHGGHPADAGAANGIKLGRGPAASNFKDEAPPAPAFKSTYEYVDKASGNRLLASITNDTQKLEQFIREAQLSPGQERNLRSRYEARRQVEAAMAAEMVRAGAWEASGFADAQARFWSSEFEALPPPQRSNLSPDFFPPR